MTMMELARGISGSKPRWVDALVGAAAGAADVDAEAILPVRAEVRDGAVDAEAEEEA